MSLKTFDLDKIRNICRGSFEIPTAHAGATILSPIADTKWVEVGSLNHAKCAYIIMLSYPFVTSDAVTRPILVEPEGFEREVVNSSFMCGHGKQKLYTRLFLS